MRRLTPVIALAALVMASLAACAPAATGIADCSPYSAGDAASTVTAKGDIGAEPTVDFPTPLIAKKNQIDQLTHGDGRELATGDIADVAVTVLDGATGKVVVSAGYDDQTLPRPVGGDNSIDESLTCATVGSRLAVSTTAAAAFGKGTLVQNGFEDSATLVLVIDVKHRFLGKADGQNQLQTPGLPSVVTATDGHPGIVLPQTAAPKKKKDAVVKAGSGEKVDDGDTVLIKYSQWSWTGKEATTGTSTWDSGSPTLIIAGKIASDDTSTPAFAPDLVGTKVGSQLMFVLPGDGADAVYVVDVLGITS